MRLLEARGLGRKDSATGRWLLEAVDLSLDSGERMAISGPSGAGKTLLLRALGMLDPVQAGSILWRGGTMRGSDVPKFRRSVIYVRQRPSLFPGTVRDNLRAPFTLTGAVGEYADSLIRQQLAGLGLSADFLETDSRNLSGGETQAVALLRALQLNPIVLLLDEAFSAMDSATAQGAEGLVENWLRADSARALLLVTHHEAQAERLAKRRIRMRHGHIVPESAE